MEISANWRIIELSSYTSQISIRQNSARCTRIIWINASMEISVRLLTLKKILQSNLSTTINMMPTSICSTTKPNGALSTSQNMTKRYASMPTTGRTTEESQIKFPTSQSHAQTESPPISSATMKMDAPTK